MMHSVSGSVATSGAIGANNISGFSDSPQRKWRNQGMANGTRWKMQTLMERSTRSTMFDKKMADVIYQWRHHLHDAESESWKTQKGCNGIVDMVFSKVTRYMETFKAKEVEFSPEHKRK
jgi:hypothetical protein